MPRVFETCEVEKKPPGCPAVFRICVWPAYASATPAPD